MTSPLAAQSLPPVCGIVPPYLLTAVARGDNATAARRARRTIARDARVRGWRELRSSKPMPGHGNGFVPADLRQRAQQGRVSDHPVAAPSAANPRRSIYDARHLVTLPGTLVRSEGRDATPDIAATEAYDGLGAMWEVLYRTYGRDSLDAEGLPLVATVHYDRNYDNAFWDGVQMVFGDGDGIYFDSFTSSIDIMGHELAHGLTQYSAALVYVGESGALNESVSDVFGSMVKQYSRGQSAAEADWLIGQGLFTAKVNGVALRSMIAPGTAYDDPVLGKDPQPADMDHFVDLPHDGNNDNGGVHINSGIPNRAFALAATSVGGRSWEGVGWAWYDALTTGGMPKDVDFAGFAAATIAAADHRWGAGSAQSTAIGDAWVSVKVLRAPEA